MTGPSKREFSMSSIKLKSRGNQKTVSGMKSLVHVCYKGKGILKVIVTTKIYCVVLSKIERMIFC